MDAPLTADALRRADAAWRSWNMGNVISLDEYRNLKLARDMDAAPTAPAPVVDRRDIVARDFSQFESILYGMLKIKEIMAHHLYYHEDWKHYLLCILDSVCYPERRGPDTSLDNTLEMFKGYIAQETNQDNIKDFSMVLLILDLISRSPIMGRVRLIQAGLERAEPDPISTLLQT
jgi:hypothetical protein